MFRRLALLIFLVVYCNGSIIAKREALEEGRCVTSRDCGIGKKCHRWNLDVLHQNHPLGWCDGGSPDRVEEVKVECDTPKLQDEAQLDAPEKNIFQIIATQGTHSNVSRPKFKPAGNDKINSRAEKCQGIEGLGFVGLDQWCNNNCQRGFCPRTFCHCYWLVMWTWFGHLKKTQGQKNSRNFAYQGIFQKPQSFANSELGVVAEKCLQKSLDTRILKYNFASSSNLIMP